MATKVNYNDERFKTVKTEEKAAVKESNATYDKMINSSDKYYQDQIKAAENYGKTQQKNQQAQTDFTIEKIEQNKDQARTDYLREQSGAYVDWQRQSNQYGSNAEQQAQMGLAHSGYSESSQVSMYNQYQNRVATARESYNRTILEYDNAIKDARIQNNTVLAEIAYNTLQTKLSLSLQGFQYKNQLILDKANKKAEINDRYYARYQNVLSQINTENALAEQIRQFNANLAEEKRQYNQSLAFQREQFNYQKSKSSGGTKKIPSGGTKKIPSGGTKKIPSGGTNKNPTVDMKSVLALGYGPISASRLNELVSSGQVIETEKNGVLTYKRVSTPKKTSSLLNRSNLPKSIAKKLGLG